MLIKSFKSKSIRMLIEMFSMFNLLRWSYLTIFFFISWFASIQFNIVSRMMMTDQNIHDERMFIARYLQLIFSSLAACHFSGYPLNYCRLNVFSVEREPVMKCVIFCNFEFVSFRSNRVAFVVTLLVLHNTYIMYYVFGVWRCVHWNQNFKFNYKY